MRVPILSLLAIAACTACQPAAKPSTPATQTWEEFTRTRPDRFIESYQASLDADAAQLAAAGLAEQRALVRTYVTYYLPPGDYTLRATGANAAVLRQLRVESTTNFLVRTGYRARHFANAGQAQRLVAAAAGTVGGPTREDDLALVAPTVAIVDLLRVDTADDGTRTLVYRIVEPLKQAPAKGKELRLPLGGPVPPRVVQAPGAPPPPPPPMPGEEVLSRVGRVVLFLAPGTLNPEAGAAPPRRLTMPMSVDDAGAVEAGYHSMAPSTTLDKLRAAIRSQVCAPGFVPVGLPASTIAC